MAGDTSNFNVFNGASSDNGYLYKDSNRWLDLWAELHNQKVGVVSNRYLSNPDIAK